MTYRSENYDVYTIIESASPRLSRPFYRIYYRLIIIYMIFNMYLKYDIYDQETFGDQGK